MPNYYCRLTPRGAEKLAQAAVAGPPLQLAAIAVGDGNPLELEPTDATVLVGERYRMAVNTVYSPIEDQSVVIVEAAIPIDIGGWEVNEVGLFDSAGELVAIANYPRTRKTVITNGIGRVLLIRIMVDVGNADHVTLQVDPAAVMATRQFVTLTLDSRAASEIDAEGAENLSRWMSPLRVLQLLRAAAANASESLRGSVRLATVGETIAGLLDTVAVTPKGLAAMLGLVAAPGDLKISFSAEIPSGYLFCNGAPVSRAAYSALFAKIGTTFGPGNGSTTFNLPDMRGEFIRGWDNGRGVDIGRVLGSWQADKLRSHNHSGTTSSAGSHAHTQTLAVNNSGGEDGNYATDGYGGQKTSAENNPAGDHAHTLNINSTGENETVPRNVALPIYIKF